MVRKQLTIADCPFQGEDLLLLNKTQDGEFHEWPQGWQGKVMVVHELFHIGKGGRWTPKADCQTRRLVPKVTMTFEAA